jgi:putative SOS response-associated peptidase YedK
MCNDDRLLLNAAAIFEEFSEVNTTIRFSDGKPNLEAREDIKSTDMSPIVRPIGGGGAGCDLVQLRWSWPGPKGKPVYNFRSEGRGFAAGRRLIPADGFYEFTDPPEKRRSDRQLVVHEKRRAVVLLRRCLAGRQGRWRGLHNANAVARPRYRTLP